MHRDQLARVIEQYDRGEIGRDALLDLLGSPGFADLGHAKVDTSRPFRTGYPEAVYCPGKTVEQVAQIAGELHRRSGLALLTKVEPGQMAGLRRRFPGAAFHERAGMAVIGKGLPPEGLVSVLTGGTADIPVAEEAAVTAEALGSRVQRVFDVGVAGIHRLFAHREAIAPSNVIVAVAGMEGALASVVGGLFDIPIIGVPTDTGYGTSFHGIAPLLTMLNSCAPGVSVVNVNNGFGAGYLAALINRKIAGACVHTGAGRDRPDTAPGAGGSPGQSSREQSREQS